MPTDAQKAWNNNNVAHTDTWGYLLLYEELNATFWDARDIAMSELAFYNPASSAGFLEKEARNLAARLDRAYRMKFGAVFEKGWNVPDSIDALTLVLKKADKLVCDLAIKVDDIYSFSGEKSP